MLSNIMEKYSLKLMLLTFLLFNVLSSILITYIAMSFLENPNYMIGFLIAALCSFFGSLIMITPSIILYIRIDKVKKQAEKNFKIDSLTQLLSRKPFSEELHKTLMSKSNLTIGIIFIDLDYFKRVNDNYGHLAGDEVMIEVGRVLNNEIPINGCFARYGGEEFIGMTTNINILDFEVLLEQIRSALDSSITYEKMSITFTASIGGVLAYNRNIDYDELLKLADSQMYHAKSKGRNRVECLELMNNKTSAV